ncbi:MAG: hypothetical protein IJ828_00860 [Treponema sp.]|nr:hypothetical protein [Treponema sp.]
MKNFEKIQNMTLEELAEYHYKVITEFVLCTCCAKNPKNCSQTETSCKEGIKQWLESEADEIADKRKMS